MDSHMLDKLPRKVQALFQSEDASKSLLQKARCIYRDFRRLAKLNSGLPALLTEGFDNEQIFNMLGLLDGPESASVSEEAIAELVQEVKEGWGSGAMQDSGLEMSPGEELDDDDDDGGDDHSGDDSDVALSSDEEHEMLKRRIASRLEGDDESDGGGLDDLVDGEDDEEEEDEDMEEEDDEDDSEDDDGVTKEKSKQSNQKSVRSEVDDEFFNLEEMEKFLDQEDRKAAASDEEEEEEAFLDDEEALDEDDKPVMYQDFFDPPKEEPKATKRKAREGTQSKEPSNEGANKRVKFAESSDESSEEEGPVSFHEKRMKKMKAVIEAQEKLNLQEKEWQMTGEVTSRLRPENSLLEVTVNHTTAVPTDPEITEKTTEDLESWIKQRIKDKAWDDVVRKVKPKEDAFQYRKRLTLESSKSEKSLMAEYEDMYRKETQPEAQQREEVKDPKKEAIKKSMKELFQQLDILSHFTYNPRKPASEIRIVNNTPALAQEEVAPVGMSDAALLAPEEVQAPLRQEMKAKSERTSTDQKRERRWKKVHQRKKFQKEEEKEKRKGSSKSRNKKEKEKLLKSLPKRFKGVTVQM